MHRPFHLLNFRMNKELKEVYISTLLRGLSMGMIAIFVPLYFMKELGLGLTTVLYFYTVLYVLFMVFSPLAAKISSKIGSKHTILASVPLYIVYLGLLYSIKDYNWSLELVAGMSAAASAFFWIPFHTDFIYASDKKHRGEEVGLRFFLTSLFGLFGPFIGGAILYFFGFNILFVIVSLIMFASAIPLLFSPDIHINTEFSLSYVFNKSHFKDILGFIGMGMRDGAAGILWPIFIFFMVGSYLVLGGILTGAGIISAFFFLYMGRVSDRFNKRKLIRMGTVSHSITWLGRSFVDGVLAVFGVQMFSNLTFAVLDVPYNALVCDKATKTNVPEYMVFREMALAVGKLFLFFVLFVTGSFAASFIAAGLAMNLIFFI